MTKRKYLSELNAEAVRLTCEYLEITEDELFDAIMSDHVRTAIKGKVAFYRKLLTVDEKSPTNILQFNFKKGV